MSGKRKNEENVWRLRPRGDGEESRTMVKEKSRRRRKR